MQRSQTPVAGEPKDAEKGAMDRGNCIAAKLGARGLICDQFPCMKFYTGPKSRVRRRAARGVVSRKWGLSSVQIHDTIRDLYRAIQLPSGAGLG